MRPWSYGAADNRTAQLAVWDEDALGSWAKEDTETAKAVGFSDSELGLLLGEGAPQPILAAYAGGRDRAALAPVLETWDKALGRLTHVDPHEVLAELRAELRAGVEQLVAVRGEIKRRDRATRPAA